MRVVFLYCGYEIFHFSETFCAILRHLENSVFYLIPPTIRLNRVYSSTRKIIEESGRPHALMEAKMKALDSINPFF